jgi:peptidoglycan hydrolase-like protein with peptidoglycan-binding domain
VATRPVDNTPLSGDDARDLQRRLKAAGFDPGPVDGIVGPRTSDAARRYAEARTLASTDAARAMLVRLRAEPTRSAEPTQSAELPTR